MNEPSDEAKAWHLTAAAIVASHRSDTLAHLTLAILIVCQTGLIAWMDYCSRHEQLQEIRRNSISQNQNVSVSQPKGLLEDTTETLLRTRNAEHAR